MQRAYRSGALKDKRGGMLEVYVKYKYSLCWKNKGRIL